MLPIVVSQKRSRAFLVCMFICMNIDQSLLSLRQISQMQFILREVKPVLSCTCTTLYLHYLVLTLSRVSSPNSCLLCAVGYPEEKSILVVQSYNPRICWLSIHYSHFFQNIALISIFIRGFRRLMNFWLASRSFKRQSSTRVTNQHTNYDEPAYL